MNELIAIGKSEIGQGSVQTVNARDLHLFLQSRQDFSDWIKKRIKQYGFAEDVDFVLFHNSMENPNGGRPAIDYHLTIDMAKELSMVERNEKGKQARQYFIECERKALATPQQDPINILNDPAAMRGLLLTYSEKVLALEATVAEQAPTVAAMDRLTNADGLLCLRDAAKVLGVPQKKLNNHLQAKQWIYRKMGGRLIGYQSRVQQGLVDHKIHTFQTSDGQERITEQVFITAKGMAKLAQMFATPEATAEN